MKSNTVGFATCLIYSIALFHTSLKVSTVVATPSPASLFVVPSRWRPGIYTCFGQGGLMSSLPRLPTSARGWMGVTLVDLGRTQLAPLSGHVCQSPRGRTWQLWSSTSFEDSNHHSRLLPIEHGERRIDPTVRYLPPSSSIPAGTTSGPLSTIVLWRTENQCVSPYRSSSGSQYHSFGNSPSLQVLGVVHSISCRSGLHS